MAKLRFKGSPENRRRSRSRSPRRERDQDRDRRTSYRERDDERDNYNRNSRRGGNDDDNDDQPRRRRSPAAAEEGEAPPASDEQSSRSEKKKEKTKKDKPKKPAATAAPVPGQPMIIVHVNDRLGTKASVPCFASDPIKLFKAQVAAQIGRQPHEILLKRQSERPFNDALTLEDYGISNGVQIDLELDTGD